MQSSASRSLVGILAAATLALLWPPATARAALTILSSTRSASAQAHAYTDDGGTDNAASNSTTDPGSFNFSPGPVSVTGSHNTDVGLSTFVCQSTTSLTSNLSPTTGFSVTSSLHHSVQGGYPQFSYIWGSTATGEVTYTTSFTVDAPTSFTLSGNAYLDNFSYQAYGTYRIQLSLTDFFNIDYHGTFANVPPYIVPTPASGTLLPGKTYTLSADLYLQSQNVDRTVTYAPSAVLNFNLGNLTVVPEPATLATLLPAALAATTARRRRRA